MRRFTLTWALLGCMSCQFPEYGFLPCEPGSEGCSSPDGVGDAGAEGGACAPIVFDSFSREGARGFGAPEIGGAWTVTNADVTSVSGGVGRMTMARGLGAEATIDGLAVLDADVSVTVSSDKSAGDGVGGTNGIYAYIFARKGAAGSYWVGLWITEKNAVRLAITRFGGDGDETRLQLSDEVFGLDAVPGTRLRLRMQVQGATPTVVRGRVWKDGDVEPSSWLVEASDATPAYQAAGSVALKAYVSALAPNAPVTIAFDDFEVRPLGGCR